MLEHKIQAIIDTMRRYLNDDEWDVIGNAEYKSLKGVMEALEKALKSVRASGKEVTL